MKRVAIFILSAVSCSPKTFAGKQSDIDTDILVICYWNIESNWRWNIFFTTDLPIWLFEVNTAMQSGVYKIGIKRADFKSAMRFKRLLFDENKSGQNI